jgi:hypothetical protein
VEQKDRQKKRTLEKQRLLDSLGLGTHNLVQCFDEEAVTPQQGLVEEE